MKYVPSQSNSKNEGCFIEFEKIQNLVGHFPPPAFHGFDIKMTKGIETLPQTLIF